MARCLKQQILYYLHSGGIYRSFSHTFLLSAHAQCLTRPTKCHVDIWQFSRVAWLKPLTRVKANTSIASARRKCFSSGFSTTLRKFAKSQAHVGGDVAWAGTKMGGGGLYMCRFWLAARTHFLPFYINRNRSQESVQRARNSPLSALCQNVFIGILFYFIGFWWFHCLSLGPQQWSHCGQLPLAAFTQRCKRNAYANFKLTLAEVWQVPQGVGWRCAT